jgi:hypothetical protein
MRSNGVEEQVSEDEDEPAVKRPMRSSRRAPAGGRGKRYALDSSEGEDDEEEDDGEKARGGQAAGARAKKGKKNESAAEKSKKNESGAAESDQSHGSVVYGSSPAPSSFGGLGLMV